MLLPVWLLLAPRDYLSTFVKLGVIFLLAVGIFLTHPQSATAPLDTVCGWNRPHLRRQSVSVLFHYHRLRSDLRLSRADLFRDDAENDRA